MGRYKQKIYKCKYCDREVKRNIIGGVNKGYLRTCGRKKCLTASYRDPKVTEKKRHPRESNPMWLGDRKKLKRPLTSYEGSVWRLAVYERDEFTCQVCGRRGGKLEAHHIKSYSLFPKLRFEVSNGLTLCKECHKDTPTYGWKMTNYLKRRGADYSALS